MKKILTVSLVAMMAVSAARADIASTAYVQGAVSAETGARTQAITALETAYKAADKTLTDNLSGVTTRVGTAEGKITTLEGTVSGHTQDIADINAELDTMATSETVQGIQNSLSTLQSTVNTNKTAADKTQTDLDTLEATVADHATEIADINTALGGKQATISDLATIRSNAAEGATAVQKTEVTTGTTNGTILVQGSEVAVKGLGSAAYTESSAYATAAQGALADSAVQKVATGSANGTIKVDNTDVAVKGLGSAAYTDASAYATSDQGTAATTAKAVTDLISAGTTGSDGTYVLTATVSNNTVTGYKWELIDRAYSN